MKETINKWVDNVHRYGFYTEKTNSNGAIYFENDKADFESESEFNREMTAQIAFEDNHVRK